MFLKLFTFHFSLFTFLLLLGASPIQAASPNVPLGSWVYPYIEKLSNLGYMESYIAGQLPLTRMEAALLIEQAEERYKLEGKASNPIPSILNRLKREFREEMNILSGKTDYLSYLKPAQSFYFEYPYLGGSMDMENEAGRIYGEDSNFQGGFIARGGLGNRFAFLVHPEFRQRNGLGYDTEIIEAYGKFSLKSLEIQWGRDTMWWGQGRHGNLHLTNNTKAFKMIKWGNSTSTLLPWILRHLGAFKFNFFIAALDEDRPKDYVDDPKFSGLKFSFKPHPLVEVGLSRTFLYEDMGDFWDALLARGENEPGGSGNQQAGFDWRLTLPFKFQPITLYGEHGGEDEAGLLPTCWAHVWGIHLPRILSFDRLDLRIEYANTNLSKNPDAWYTHSTLPYTYKDRIMGHHMGSDAQDLFINLNYYLNQKFIVGFSFDQEHHGISKPITEKKREYTFSVEYWLKDYVNWYGTFQWEDIDNQEFSLGNDQGTGYIRIGTAFYF